MACNIDGNALDGGTCQDLGAGSRSLGVADPLASHWSYTGFPWLWCYIGFFTGLELFEQYLNIRQYRKYCQKEMPESARAMKMITEEEFAKSQHYSRDKMMFAMVTKTFDLLVTLVFLVSFVYPQVWEVAGMVASNEYLQSLVFMFLISMIDSCKDIPTSWYFDFVIEQRHGFNKKTLGIFVSDICKGFVLNYVIGGPVVCAIIAIIKWGGSYFYLYLWVFVIVFALVMMILYPNVIAPCFNKFEPLRDEELRGKINDLASELKFPLTELYQMDASKRSAHSNAYFYGFWKWKRIVLFDTILETSHDQILAILGHELGHWKMNHMLKTMVISFGHIFVLLYLYGVVMTTDSLYESFGFHDTRAVIVGLILFMMIYSPVEAVLNVLVTLMSRVHEFQADAFAAKWGFGEPLKGGLVHISMKSKASMCPDSLYAWYHYSHPHLFERLLAIDKIMKQNAPPKHSILDGKPPPPPKEPKEKDGDEIEVEKKAEMAAGFDDPERREDKKVKAKGFASATDDGSTPLLSTKS